MADESLIIFSDSNFEEEVLNSNSLILVDFWAPWCGPCKMITPIIEEIAKEYKGKIKVGKFNVDESSSIPARYRIRSIPTIMLFKFGKMVQEIVGAVPKSTIVNAINEKM